MLNLPTASAKIRTGDFDHFTSFMKRLVSVPHTEIKAKLDAEREARRASKASASLGSGA
jgi:hypothetical protein